MMGALKQLDYSEHGGAPLLGVNGVSIISHGKSSPRAIKNAIKVAVQAVESRMNEHIGRRLAAGARRRAHEATRSRTSPAPGAAFPPTVMTNHDFAALGIETTDEWIVERTGISERHIARRGETTCSHGRRRGARRRWSARACTPASSTSIVLSTATPDRLLPSTAVDLQAALGASARRGVRHRRRLLGIHLRR